MEQHDPSFHLIVISDLAPGSSTPLRAKGVDKDNLDAFLREVGPSIGFELGGSRSQITLQEFKDFRPERLAARLPAIANLLEFRRQVLELAGGGGSIDAARATLGAIGAFPELAAALETALLPKTGAVASSAPPSPLPPSPAPKGGVFELVDAESEHPPQVSSVQAEKIAAKLVDAVLGPSSVGVRPAPAGLRAVAAGAEAAISPLLRTVLDAPGFRDLEASWRGLRFLVRSTDFRAGCRLHVIAAPRTRLLGTLQEVALPLADDLRGQGKTVCLLLDFLFDGSEGELLAIAQAAESRSLPVLASAGLEVALRDLALQLGDASQEVWSRLRSAPAARWVALAANRILLRAPYGAAADPVRDLRIEELEGPEPMLTWGRPGWLLAALVAQSFARTGWGSDFAGRDSAEAMEPLPLRPGPDETTPLESDLTEAAGIALGDAGLLPLACRRGRDHPFAAGTSTVYRAKKGEPTPSLRSAFFAAGISAAVESLLGHLDLSSSLREIAKTLAAALQILGMTEGQSLFTVKVDPDPSGRPALAVRLHPQGGALRGLPELAFEIPIALH